MERVQGIGGVFLRARGDRQKLLEWYRDNLGIDLQDWGGTVLEDDGTLGNGLTWSIFKSDTTYFGPPNNQSMINYKVRNLKKMLAQLRKAGVEVDEKTESSEYGHFGWATDPEGNRFELWQPPEEAK